MLHIPLLKHNGPTPVKWVVAVSVCCVSLCACSPVWWMSRSGALDRREPVASSSVLGRLCLIYCTYSPPPHTACCRSFGIAVTRQCGLIWNFSCSSQVTEVCKQNLKSVHVWKVGYKFPPPIKIRRAWFAKLCKAAELLRFKFWNLWHPFCKSPDEGVFSFVLGFQNQLASFWLWRKQEASSKNLKKK